MPSPRLRHAHGNLGVLTFSLSSLCPPWGHFNAELLVKKEEDGPSIYKPPELSLASPASLFSLKISPCRGLSITVVCPTSASILNLLYSPSLPLASCPIRSTLAFCPRRSITLLSSVWVKNGPRRITTEGNCYRWDPPFLTGPPL
jgi:hypothetical protein